MKGTVQSQAFIMGHHVILQLYETMASGRLVGCLHSMLKWYGDSDRALILRKAYVLWYPEQGFPSYTNQLIVCPSSSKTLEVVLCKYMLQFTGGLFRQSYRLPKVRYIRKSFGGGWAGEPDARQALQKHGVPRWGSYS